MVVNQLVNSALNELYLYFLGNGKINTKTWEVVKQTGFDDYLDELNALFENDTDLQHIDILKKGFANTANNNKIGIYIRTDSSVESVVVNFSDNTVYATVFVDIRLRDEQSAYVWKYQDAVTDFLMSKPIGLETLGIIPRTYNKDNQDVANYATIRVDFILDNLVDEN